MNINYIKIVLAALLIICIFNMPYGYYQFVRYTVMLGFTYLVFSLDSTKNKNEVFLYIGLALLFQPFIKIALGRTLWNVVDLFVGIGLLASLAIQKKTSKN